MTALHREVGRTVDAVAGTSMTAGGHAARRAGVAASRLVESLLGR